MFCGGDTTHEKLGRHPPGRSTGTSTSHQKYSREARTQWTRDRGFERRQKIEIDGRLDRNGDGTDAGEKPDCRGRSEQVANAVQSADDHALIEQQQGESA